MAAKRGGRNAAKAPNELRAILWSARGPVVAAAVFSLFINLLMLTPPIYMLQMYDRVLSSRSEETLLMLTLVVVLLMAIMGLLEWTRQRVMVRAGTLLDDKLSERLHEALFQRGLIAGNSGDSQPMKDANQIRQFMTGNGLFAFLDVPWLPIFITVLFLFHPLIGMVGLIGAIILVILGIANHYASRTPLQKANAENIAEQRALTSQLRNAEAAEAMGMTGQLMRRWQRRHQRTLAFQAQASDRASPYYAASRAFRMLLQSLVLGAGAYLAIHQIITPGVMIAGSILLGRALAPLDQLIGQWRNITSVRQAYNRLSETLANFPARQRHMSLPEPKGKVAAEGLVVVPPGNNDPVVRGASFTIQPGENVGIMGPSGAGKSSLLRGLLGVWPARAGHARIDDADMGEWNRDELGAKLGYLPQDVELFDGTVAENIARFRDDQSPDRIVAAAETAGVHELILHLPEGYDTQLGPGGVTLSAGQRQRIGLARALYGEPTILALDEPNANLDDHGEQALAQALRAGRVVGRTQIVVSHRQALRGELDRIIVIKQGRVAMDDTADKVLEKLKGGRNQRGSSAS